ncbi:MAG: vWA domain-containing protein [Planctomycetota bacterium]
MLLILWGTIACLMSAPAVAQEEQQRARPVGNASARPVLAVVATDSSGSMKLNDPVFRGPEGEERALRFDAQVTFLSLLALRQQAYIGTLHFGDQIRRAMPPEGLARLGADSDFSTFLPGRPAESTGGTDIARAMQEGLDRIEAMRRRTGSTDPAVFVLISDGDPDQAARELASPRSSRVLALAEQFRQESIRVYSVILNRASHRPGRAPGLLSQNDLAGARLMRRIAERTRGRAFEITEQQGFLEVFTDILGTRATEVNAEMTVSQGIERVLILGRGLRDLEIEVVPDQRPGSPTRMIRPFDPAGAGNNDQSVRTRLVPFGEWDLVLIQRPRDENAFREFWEGIWRLTIRGIAFRGGVYLVPDFTFDLDFEQPAPRFERQTLSVRAEQKPRRVEDVVEDIPIAASVDLLNARLVPIRGGPTIELPQMRPTDGGRTWISGVFEAPPAGEYVLVAEAFDRVLGSMVKLDTFETEVLIDSFPVTAELREVGGRDEPLLDLVQPQGAATEAGSAVVARARSGDRRLTGARLLLDGVREPIELIRAGVGLESGSFRLPDTRRSVGGRLVVEYAGNRIQLPEFELYMSQGPLPVETEEIDARPAWVGEMPVRSFTVRVRNVFNESRAQVRDELLRPRQGGLLQGSYLNVSHDIPLVIDTPNDVQETPVGDTWVVEATYRVRATAPVPEVGRWSFDTGIVVLGEAVRAQDLSVEAMPVLWRIGHEQLVNLNRSYAAPLFEDAKVWWQARWPRELGLSSLRFIVEGEPGAAIDLASDGSSAVHDAHWGLRPGTYQIQLEIGVEGEPEPRRILPLERSVTVSRRAPYYNSFGWKPPDTGEAGEGFRARVGAPVSLPFEVMVSRFDRDRHTQLIAGLRSSLRLRVFGQDGELVAEQLPDLVSETQNLDELGFGDVTLVGSFQITPEFVGRAVLELSAELQVSDTRVLALRDVNYLSVAPVGIDVTASPGATYLLPSSVQVTSERESVFRGRFVVRGATDENGVRRPILDLPLELQPGESRRLDVPTPAPGDYAIFIREDGMPPGEASEVSAATVRAPVVTAGPGAQVPDRFTLWTRAWPFRIVIPADQIPGTFGDPNHTTVKFSLGDAAAYGAHFDPVIDDGQRMWYPLRPSKYLEHSRSLVPRENTRIEFSHGNGNLLEFDPSPPAVSVTEPWLSVEAVSNGTRVELSEEAAVEVTEADGHLKFSITPSDAATGPLKDRWAPTWRRLFIELLPATNAQQPGHLSAAELDRMDQEFSGRLGAETEDADGSPTFNIHVREWEVDTDKNPPVPEPMRSSRVRLDWEGDVSKEGTSLNLHFTPARPFLWPRQESLIAVTVVQGFESDIKVLGKGIEEWSPRYLIRITPVLPWSFFIVPPLAVWFGIAVFLRMSFVPKPEFTWTRNQRDSDQRRKFLADSNNLQSPQGTFISTLEPETFRSGVAWRDREIRRYLKGNAVTESFLGVMEHLGVIGIRPKLLALGWYLLSFLWCRRHSVLIYSEFKGSYKSEPVEAGGVVRVTTGLLGGRTATCYFSGGKSAPIEPGRSVRACVAVHYKTEEQSLMTMPVVDVVCDNVAREQEAKESDDG